MCPSWAALSVGVKIQPCPLAAKPAVNICGVGVTPELLMGLFRSDVSFQQPDTAGAGVVSCSCVPGCPSHQARGLQVCEDALSPPSCPEWG